MQDSLYFTWPGLRLDPVTLAQNREQKKINGLPTGPYAVP